MPIPTRSIADIVYGLKYIYDWLVNLKDPDNQPVFGRDGVKYGRPKNNVQMMRTFPTVILTFDKEHEGPEGEETENSHVRIVDYILAIYVRGPDAGQRETDALTIRAAIDALRYSTLGGLALPSYTKFTNVTQLGPNILGDDNTIALLMDGHFGILVDNVSPNRLIEQGTTQSGMIRFELP
jgi:hypothetical protein